MLMHQLTSQGQRSTRPSYCCEVGGNGAQCSQATQTWERGCRERVRLAWHDVYDPHFLFSECGMLLSTIGGARCWLCALGIPANAQAKQLRSLGPHPKSCYA